jgi:hypothetical protein
MIGGIDLSSFAVDVVLLEDDTDAATWHRFDLTGRTPFERARSLRGVFPTRSWWEEQGVWLLGIEDPYSASKGVAKALGMATGAVAALLPRDLTVIQTAPTEWKRLTVGASNASKDQVARWAACFGFEPGDLNATDAYAIARAIRLLNQRAVDAA